MSSEFPILGISHMPKHPGPNRGPYPKPLRENAWDKLVSESDSVLRRPVYVEQRTARFRVLRCSCRTLKASHYDVVRLEKSFWILTIHSFCPQGCSSGLGFLPAGPRTTHALEHLLLSSGKSETQSLVDPKPGTQA